MRVGKNPVEMKKNNYGDLDQLIMPSLENLEKIRNCVINEIFLLEILVRN
jgi:hypothetical protein